MLAVRLAFALFGAFWGTWAVAALDIQEFLDVSDSQLGLLVAATVAGTSVANVAGGALTERLGVGRATAAALGVWAVALAPLALVPSPVAWMALFLAAVAAGGLLDVVLNVASTSALADRPGRLLRVHAAYNGGAVSGAALTGALVAAGLSWRWALGAIAGGAGALALAVARRRRHATPALAVAQRASMADAFRELRRSRLVPLALAMALGAMVEGGIGTFGVLYLRDRLDVAVLAGAGAYVAGQTLATGARIVLGSPRGERLLAHRTRAARAGLALAAGGLVLEAATGVAGIAAAGLAVAAVGAATYWPLLSAHANRSSDRPGLAVGGVSAAGYFGFLAGPPLVGLVADGAGLRAGLLALAVAGAAAASVRLRTSAGTRSASFPCSDGSAPASPSPTRTRTGSR